MARSLLAILVVIAGTGTAACGGGEAPVPIPDTCNGDSELCERRYDSLAYPTTHNAMSNADAGWLLPNQEHGLTRQLEDGIRGFMLDTHSFEGEPYLCHGDCLLGSQRLVDGLGELETFLAAHPGEVVSIILEAYVDPAATEAAFAASGLLDRVYAGAPRPSWPTLRQLIDTGEQVVVFTDDGTTTLPWYRHVWDYAWETHYAAREISDFSCDDNRGEPGADLFILNHFLTRTRPVPQEAAQTNDGDLLYQRSRECELASGQPVNFLTVDFYATGDVVTTAHALNQVQESG